MLALRFTSALLLASALASSAAAQAADEGVTLSVRLDRGLVLHEGDTELCWGPCSLELEPGLHTLGVSRGRGEVLRAAPIEIDRAGTLHVEHVSRSGSRMGGWIAFTLGLITAVTCGAVGAVEIDKASRGGESPLQSVFGYTMLGAGGLHLLIGLVAGLPLAAAGDGAVVRFD